MTEWYVKDLSRLTGVSVQTLHHYDRIGLLKPSVRLDNGYRLYSEKDLLKLQQIIALKFFGFELSKIKTLLMGNVDALEHFSAQAQFLEEKAKTLLQASGTLKSILSEMSGDKSIPWETIIQLIEVYRMTQQLERTWVGKVLSKEELKQYLNFEAGLKNRFTLDEKNEFEKKWSALIAEINTNLHRDPKSDFGIRIAKESMEMVNGLYGKEHANLRHSIWENGFKKGQMDDEHALALEVVEWLDEAISAYYRERIYGLLEEAEQGPTASLQAKWDDLMEEMFGDSQSLKQAVIDEAQTDSRVGNVARKWLQG